MKLLLSNSDPQAKKTTAKATPNNVARDDDKRADASLVPSPAAVGLAGLLLPVDDPLDLTERPVGEGKTVSVAAAANSAADE